MANNSTIIGRVQNWNTRSANYKSDGLVLIRDVCMHIANQRDWDATAKLYQKADDTFRKTLKLALSACFGNAIVMQTGKAANHPTGVRFKLKWEGSITPGNAFGIVNEAVDNKLAYDSKALVKGLSDAINPPKEEEEKPFDVEALVKREIKKLVAEGVPFDAYLSELRKQMAPIMAEEAAIRARTQAAQQTNDKDDSDETPSPIVGLIENAA